MSASDFQDTQGKSSVNLDQEVTEPSYDNVLDWMRKSKSRSFAYDFWNRGNYTRRLIYQRNSGIKPLHVQVSYINEIRWAYRRLALLGMPVEFIYDGYLSEEQKIAYVDVAPEIFDAGNGYNGTLMKMSGKYYCALFGAARLLPSTVTDWIVEEASEDFANGRVIISPTELIGIDTNNKFESTKILSSITNGVILPQEVEVARTFMELKLPYLDNMSSYSFTKFLKEYESEIINFQKAFQKLVINSKKTEDEISENVKLLQYEISELILSDKYKNTRKGIEKFGGVIETFTISFATAAITDPLNIKIGAIASAGGAAVKGLIDLYNQSSKVEKEMSVNPYYVLWKLGITKLSKVKKGNRIDLNNFSNLFSDTLLQNSYHWICPPENGVWWAGTKKDE